MTTEHQFKVPAIRQAYSIDFADYGRDRVAYWFEMDHPYEGHRTFQEHLDIYLDQYQWRKIIKPNTTIIDIGAHSGDTTVIMQAMSGGTVLAVECNPEIRPWLEFACSMNRHLGKSVIANEAVTTQNCTLTFADHGNGMCNGGLIGHSWSVETKNRVAKGNSIEVPGITLPDLLLKYLTTEEIANIDLIKIDTEGHDFEILSSSRETIDILRPKLFVEWFHYFSRSDVEKMFNTIQDLDYVALYPKTFELARPELQSEDLLLVHRTKLDEFLKDAS